MQRQPKSLLDTVALTQTADVISAAVKNVTNEWAKEVTAFADGSTHSSVQLLPSQELYDAQRTIVAAVGKLVELVSEPSVRVLEIATQFQESRALYLAVERRVADVLAAEDAGHGVAVGIIADKTGIEQKKLCVFQQTAIDTFSNNGISAALVKNEPLRAYVRLVSSEAFTAADRLPKTLLDPKTGPSYDVSKTAWQDAFCTDKPRWEWIEERIEQDKVLDSGGHYPGIPSLVLEPQPKGDDGLVARPELENMGLAMVGGGKVFGSAHIYDFPWGTLGQALVVDVGGGVGGFSLQLSKLFPNLNFVIQDRGPVIKQGREIFWPKENPDALQCGRVEMVEHNFFDVNPTKAADIYYLRLVLHDWSDDYCVKILSGIRASMAQHSRLLICEQVMNTTQGDPDLPSAPEPLPANYGYYTRFSHSRDLTMMACINGIERTPAEFKTILKASGLEFKKIWSCRSQMLLIEACLPREIQTNGVNHAH